MKNYQNEFFKGERSLFALQNASIAHTTFGEGESPLKESRNIQLKHSIFKYKYPLWYSRQIKVTDTIFETMARSGIWYTQDIEITDSIFQAPKLFRRSSQITLQNDYFADAEETLWNCQDIRLENVQVTGDYFGMNSENIYADHLSVVGNYVFDGAKNVEVHNSIFVSKDAFWNCENVTIYDSTITGEYLGWNTKNLTLINCTIESEQGMCYIDRLTMKNCRLQNSDLTFEYCTEINAEITTPVISIKNPSSGTIIVEQVDQIILDTDCIDPTQTTIITSQRNEVSA